MILKVVRYLIPIVAFSSVSANDQIGASLILKKNINSKIDIKLAYLKKINTENGNNSQKLNSASIVLKTNSYSSMELGYKKIFWPEIGDGVLERRPYISFTTKTNGNELTIACEKREFSKILNDRTRYRIKTEMPLLSYKNKFFNFSQELFYEPGNSDINRSWTSLALKTKLLPDLLIKSEARHQLEKSSSSWISSNHIQLTTIYFF